VEVFQQDVWGIWGVTYKQLRPTSGGIQGPSEEPWIRFRVPMPQGLSFHVEACPWLGNNWLRVMQRYFPCGLYEREKNKPVDRDLAPGPKPGVMAADMGIGRQSWPGCVRDSCLGPAVTGSLPSLDKLQCLELAGEYPWETGSTGSPCRTKRLT
jgi:hypothetical protein